MAPLLAGLTGCVFEPTLPGDRQPVPFEVDTGMIDATPELPELRDGAMRIETPELVLEPFTDLIFCYVSLETEILNLLRLLDLTLNPQR